MLNLTKTTPRGTYHVIHITRNPKLHKTFCKEYHLWLYTSVFIFYNSALYAALNGTGHLMVKLMSL